MSFLVLSNSAIQSLLKHLNNEELIKIEHDLSQALSSFSTGDEILGYGAQHQPSRVAVRRADGNLTLFMPGTSTHSTGTKIIVSPAQTTSPRGALLLLDSSGNGTGIINASEFTAFRTALSCMILYKNRKDTSNIVVFGAGNQAAWHIRLALLLRGPDIKRITIINRSAGRIAELLDLLRRDDQSKWNSSVEFLTLDQSLPDYDNSLKGILSEANAVFCCTPSSTPLFPAEFLDTPEKLRRGCYVSAIGSHNANMTELDPHLFKVVVAAESGYHPDGGAGGVIVVDSREACQREAGEIIQGGITLEQTVDVGGVTSLLSIQASTTEVRKNEVLRDWVENGFVVYKCVGVGVMDLAVGNSLLSLARQKNLGVLVPDF